MPSGVCRREAPGGLSVESEPFIVVRATENEDRRPASLRACITAAVTRADPIPHRCRAGATADGASANARSGAVILDSRTWPTITPSSSATSAMTLSPASLNSSTSSASADWLKAAEMTLHTACRSLGSSSRMSIIIRLGHAAARQASNRKGRHVRGWTGWAAVAAGRAGWSSICHTSILVERFGESQPECGRRRRSG